MSSEDVKTGIIWVVSIVVLFIVVGVVAKMFFGASTIAILSSILFFVLAIVGVLVFYFVRDRRR